MFAALAITTLLAFNAYDTLTWDAAAYTPDNTTGYNVRCTRAGEALGTVALTPLRTYEIEAAPAPAPRPTCCDETPPPTECRCGPLMEVQYWPQHVPLIRTYDADSGAAVCCTVTAYRELSHPNGPAESPPSNEVCGTWPPVCAFTTREELLTCLGITTTIP